MKKLVVVDNTTLKLQCFTFAFVFSFQSRIVIFYSKKRLYREEEEEDEEIKQKPK